MVPLDPQLERIFLGIAHALFINRLHVLRLTEVVRLGVEPDDVDGNLAVPSELDADLRQQALDYVLMSFPEEFSVAINQAKADWLRPA